MSIRDLFAIVAKQKYFIAILAGIGVVIAVVLSVALPRSYTSQAAFYVSAQVGGENASSAYQGGLLSEQRVSSYAQLATSTRVLTEMSRELGLPTDPDSLERLAKKLSPDSSANSVLITVDATGDSPPAALNIAQAVAKVFPRVVAELERPAAPGGTPAVALRLVNPPVEPVTPSSLGPAVLLPAGLVLGALVALIVAVVRVRFDTRIRTAAGLQALVGAPTLANVPSDPTCSSTPLATAEGGSRPGARSEAYKRLRTNLKFVDVDAPPQVILVSSSVPGEGKTITSSNLAVSLALEGSATLLLDGDLRRPRVAEYFGLEGAVGLTTVLTGRISMLEAVQSLGPGRPSVMCSGEIPPNPSELLSSQRMIAMIEDLRQKFDYIVIDSPPLLLVADSAAVARSCDGVLLVGRFGSTTVEQVEGAGEAVRAVSANLLGTVLNMVPPGEVSDPYGRYGDYLNTRSDASESSESGRSRRHSETSTDKLSRKELSERRRT